MEITEVIRNGIISEKSVYLQNTVRDGGKRDGEIVPRYTFKVALEANKYEIKAAVEEMFGVRVVRVNTMRVPGKRRTLNTRKGIFHKEARPWKKAVVTLAAGQSITELHP
ncbi:MAG: 50S ribosomal protein L23 [Ktedonobacterales bacterium]